MMTEERRQAIAAMSEKRRAYIEAHIEECLSIRALMAERLPNMAPEQFASFVSATITSLAAIDAAEIASDGMGRVEQSVDNLIESMSRR